MYMENTIFVNNNKDENKIYFDTALTSSAEIRGERTRLEVAVLIREGGCTEGDQDSGPKLPEVLWDLFIGHLKNSSGRSFFCLQVSLL